MNKGKAVWHPADYEAADLRAIQALGLYAQLAEGAWDPGMRGPPPPAPSPSEVKRALDWIVHGAAQTYDNGFVPNDPGGRIAAFLDGRQSVGQQIVKLMKLKPSILDKET